jgi:glutamate/tyrosine decarboxylase-like PLP-dependent enzyme
LINRRTVLIVGSAPTYPHGVVDPIEELGALAQRRGVPLHVDACLGGFLLPFVEELGGDVQPFDFRVPGVQSMSADVHKYGFAAKGASVVLYRDMDVLKHQFFVSVDWPGGLFASPALLGTRPGGSIAAAWAAMMAMGRKGYLDNARTIMRIARKLLDGIRAIPELQVIGDPPMSVFAYGAKSRRLNIFAVGDQLERRGWHIDRIQRPDALHAMVTPWHARIADEFLRDLRDSVEYVKAHPEAALEGGAPMYGMSSKAPIRGLVRQAVLKMMMEMYGPQTIIPDPANPPDDWGARAGKYYLQLRERLADLWEEAGAEVARRVGRGRR